VFHRFDHWSKSDTYCTLVDEAVSEDIEALNGCIAVSESVPNGIEILNFDEDVNNMILNYVIGRVTGQIFMLLH
jgi:hypothetical protein